MYKYELNKVSRFKGNLVYLFMDFCMEISMKIEVFMIYLLDLFFFGLKIVFWGGIKIVFIKRNLEFVIVFDV